MVDFFKKNIPGVKILAELQKGSKSISYHYRKYLEELEDLDDKLNKINLEKEINFTKLAKKLLPKLESDKLSIVIEDLRATLEFHLNEKISFYQDLRESLGVIYTKIDLLNTELENINADNNILYTNIEQLEDKVNEKLLADINFQNLEQKVNDLLDELDEDKKRLDILEIEAKEKLVDYEKEGLFKYLHKRSWNTSKYKKFGIIRYLDSKIARILDYRNQVKSYNFLKSVPSLMAADIEQRIVYAKTLQDELILIEDKYSNQLGLVKEEQHLDLNKSNIEKISTKIKELKAEESLLVDRIEDLKTNNNKFYKKALGELKDFLLNSNPKVILKKAKITPDSEDDILLKKLYSFQELTTKNEQRKRYLENLVSNMSLKSNSMTSIIDSFLSKKYHSYSSVFKYKFDVDDYIEDFFEDKIDANYLWNLIDQNQSFQKSNFKSYPRLNNRRNVVISRTLGRALGQVLSATVRGLANGGGRGRGGRSGGGFFSGGGF